MLNNGKSQADVRDEQRENQLHQANLNAAAHEEDIADSAYIDKVTDHQLDGRTVEKLSNLLEEYPLANLSEAEVHEYRWLARVMKDEIFAMHPSQDSVFTGKVRAAAYDDATDGLSPLTQKQRATIEQFIMAAIARATKGRSGWQQEMFNKTINASETRDVSDNSGGIFR